MREIVRSVGAVLIAGVVALLVARTAEARGPSTPEEREKAVRLIAEVEADPMAFEARESRDWLVTWLGEVPDIPVSYCTLPLGDGKDAEEVPVELKMQLMLGQAAYLMGHPEARSGSLEVFVAGVESAVRAYDRLRQKGTVWKLSALEDLKKAQGDGKLDALVTKRIRKCL